MMILILLVFLSIFMAIAFLVLFLWSIKTGQYDDLYTPSIRILFDKGPDINEEDPTRDKQ